MRQALSLGAAAAALICATSAAAWEAYRGNDGQLRRWQPFPVALRLLPPGAGAAAPQGWELAARKALAQWQGVESAAVSVRYAGRAAAGDAPAAGQVLLSIDGDDFPAGRDVAGITDLVLASPDGHLVVAAHVHLNGRDFLWATDGSAAALDVQSVALHELGHALGLAHPCGDAGTNTPSCATLSADQRARLAQDVMWPEVTPGPHRLLAEDDLAGLAALQPAASPQPAPSLQAIAPTCAANLSALAVRLFAPSADGADRLVLADDGAPLADVAVQRDSSGLLAGKLPDGLRAPAGAAALDALLVASASGKAGELPAALAVNKPCPSGGCSSAGDLPSWALIALPLALFSRRRRSLGAALVAALLLVAAPAHAYKRSTAGTGGPCLFWATRGHSFMIDSRGTPDVPGNTAFDAVRRSFATWAGVTCTDLAFPDLGLSSNPDDRRIGYVPGAYNRNLVLWRTANCKLGGAPPDDPCQKAGGCGNKYDCWDHGDVVIAVTTTTFNRVTGQIYDADIELNDAAHEDGSRFRFTTVESGPTCGSPGQTGCIDYDVLNTVTHEAGHSIGLDHTSIEDATMYATAPEGDTTKRSLHQDDVDGICAIYPKGQPTSTCLGDPITLTAIGSSDGGGCGCSQRSGAGAAGPVLCLLGLLALRRRSRPK